MSRDFPDDLRTDVNVGIYPAPQNTNASYGPLAGLRWAATTMMRAKSHAGDLVAPEILEPRWRQLGVAHGVLDVAMAEPCLQGPRIVPGVRQGEAARVP